MDLATRLWSCHKTRASERLTAEPTSTTLFRTAKQKTQNESSDGLSFWSFMLANSSNRRIAHRSKNNDTSLSHRMMRRAATNSPLSILSLCATGTACGAQLRCLLIKARFCATRTGHIRSSFHERTFFA